MRQNEYKKTKKEVKKNARTHSNVNVPERLLVECTWRLGVKGEKYSSVTNTIRPLPESTTMSAVKSAMPATSTLASFVMSEDTISQRRLLTGNTRCMHKHSDRTQSEASPYLRG